MGKKSKKGRKKGMKKLRGRKTPMSFDADRHDLYQRSVQEPEADVIFMRDTFKEEFGRDPRTMREDFCGTGFLSCSWVEAKRDFFAFGIDLDSDPLEWGMVTNVSKLKKDQQKRVELIQGNALQVLPRKADILSALNFSWWIFKTRKELLEYFRAAHENLEEEGLFILDIYGGPELLQLLEEEQEKDGFSYVWDQDYSDGISNEIQTHIHFRFPDGSEMERAFSYDWRWWSIPETREALIDAGFKRAEVYWEGDDEDEDSDDGNGEFTREENAPNSEAWIAYIVAVK